MTDPFPDIVHAELWESAVLIALERLVGVTSGDPLTRPYIDNWPKQACDIADVVVARRKQLGKDPHATTCFSEDGVGGRIGRGVADAGRRHDGY